MKISAETGMPMRSEPCFCKYAKKPTDVSRSIFELLILTVLTHFLWFALGDLVFSEDSLPRL